MSLETVVEDIRAEAEAQAAAIRDDAEGQAEEIVEAAEEDAEETLETAKATASQRIDREREQQLSSATLKAKQERLAARRDVLEDVYTAVENALRDLDGERREAATEALLDAGIDQIDVDGIIRVSGRSEDQALLESLIDDRENVEYGGEYACLGGVVIESDEARVRVNNTFDSILDSVWEAHLKDISDRLFDT